MCVPLFPTYEARRAVLAVCSVGRYGVDGGIGGNSRRAGKGIRKGKGRDGAGQSGKRLYGLKWWIVRQSGVSHISADHVVEDAIAAANDKARRTERPLCESEARLKLLPMALLIIRIVQTHA